MAYSLEEARALVIKAGMELLRSGLIARTWGNISARISDTQFVITPSGRAYEDLTPEQIVITNIADCSYEGDAKPSSEKWIHADAYRLRPDVNFVIHTHQNYASALSILGEPIANIPDTQHLRELLGPVVPTAAYGLNGSKELSDNVIAAISSHPESHALLMANHGAECMGTDYQNAFDIAHALETISRARYREMLRSSLAYQMILPSEEQMDTEDALGSDLHSYYEFTAHKPSVSDTGSHAAESDSFAALSHAPFTLAASKIAVPELFPYIDDQAQIAGTSLRILPADADSASIQDALEGRNAVLLRGKGALCTGSSKDDVEAAVMVLEKGCRAALLARVVGITKEVPPIHPEHAAIDRDTYVNAYSKLKETH